MKGRGAKRVAPAFSVLYLLAKCRPSPPEFEKKGGGGCKKRGANLNKKMLLFSNFPAFIDLVRGGGNSPLSYRALFLNTP